MGWGLPWIKKAGLQGGSVIASVHQQPNEADITDTSMDSAYVCEEHADMIVKAVNHHDELVELIEDIQDHTQYMMENYGYDRGWYDADSDLEKRVNAVLKKVKP